MKLFEYMRKSNWDKLTPDRQQFMSKMIANETKRIALEHNISEEAAYDALVHGLFGADREIDE